MARSTWWRLPVHGFLAGVLLSVLRAPLGLDWTQIPATLGTTAALFRAGALLALALSLDATRAALRDGLRPAWLGALCLGYGVHGLLLDVVPGTRAGFALALLVFTLLLRFLAGPRGAPSGPSAATTLGRSERLGLVLVGLGVGFAFETLAREVRLFTLGTQPGETVVGVVFLALVAVAAAAFGPLCVKVGQERTRFAAGLGLAGASSLAGLWFLAQLSPEGLHGYLRRLDVFVEWGRVLDGKLGGVLNLAALPPLDGASVGTLWTVALLSAAAWVVPCFVLGAALGACQHTGRPTYALSGAALGLLLLPECIRLLGRPLSFDELGAVSFSWNLLVAGATVAALGVVIVVLTSERGRTRWLGLAAAGLIAALPWSRPHLCSWVFSPWSPAEVIPELVLPSAEGLVTVERSRDGAPIVTLDRKRLTPVLDEEEIDERRLRLSWSLLKESTRQGKVRALFIGQLTPARARVLASLGDIELDRTAPWYTAVPALERLLFRGEATPLGQLIRPAEARARLAEETYDWVVVPPIRGPIVSWKSEARELWGSVDAPRLTDLDLPGTAVGVAWVVADSRPPRGAAFTPALLAQARFESLSIGVVRGAAEKRELPWFVVESVPAPSPLAFLGTIPQQRSFSLESAWTHGLASDQAPELVQGLVTHFAAQKLSSPYETRAQQIEVEEAALRSFLAAVPRDGTLDPFTQELWTSLAWLLTEKRMPEQALVFLEPVAERFAPWPALDRAVAQAYREVLEPETAMRFLERALSVERYDIGLLTECAADALELGDARRAVDFLERALALQPGRADLERARGLALLRAGDERGRPIVERFLEQEPEDRELLEALGQVRSENEGPR